jgi:chemotaxis protein methyltransferase CheR
METAAGRGPPDQPSRLPPPLALVAERLEAASGLAFAGAAERTLGDALRRAARELGLARETFVERLRGRDPAALEALVEQALVRETYFFRHPEQLAGVARWLAEAPRTRPLALWSAGCSSGEEAWTLAMLLRDAGRAGCGDTVLGTDRSPRAIAAAREARYGEWSLRGVGPALRLRHFHGVEGGVTPGPGPWPGVQFRRHDLVHEPVPGGDFDLVVCRNVLLYFRQATAAGVLRRLAEAVRPGGMLLLGPVEEPAAAALGFERVEVPGAVLWRRPGHGGGDAR